MKTSKNKKKKFTIKDFFPLFLLIATLCIGIGYAQIGSINLGINGNVTAQAQDGVFISEVSYNADESNNIDTSLNSYVETSAMLHSDIVLAEQDKTSKITYDLKIFNNSNFTVSFDEIVSELNLPEQNANNYEYIIYNIYYENENKEYVSLNQRSVITPQGEMNIRITFSYILNIDFEKVPTDYNKLKSYISFKFKSYEIIYTSRNEEQTYNEVQIYRVPITGVYKIELWGAAGGGGPRGSGENATIINGGAGGYVSGEIELQKDDILYFYVGGKGQDYPPIANTEKYEGGYNGGGNGFRYAYAGGGATDVRYFGNYEPTIDELKWDSAIGLKSRILVAGGGGAASTDYTNASGGFSYGGAGGGLTGSNSIPGTTRPSKGLGATQTSGYAFGKGYSTTSTSTSNAGGGAGYYGAARSTGSDTYDKASGGGSSFISGHTGSVAIISNSSISPRIGTDGATCSTGTTDNLCSIHYSGYSFTNTMMIDGNGCSWTNELTNNCDGMPNYDGTSTMLGNTGDGYARITIISQ